MWKNITFFSLPFLSLENLLTQRIGRQTAEEQTDSDWSIEIFGSIALQKYQNTCKYFTNNKSLIWHINYFGHLTDSYLNNKNAVL